MVKKKWLRQKGEKKNDKGQQHGLLWRKHSAGRNGRHYRKQRKGKKLANINDRIFYQIIVRYVSQLS